MLKKRSFWDTAVLHPVLFALYPLLALWMTNITQMPIYALSRAAIIVPIFLILGFGIGWLIYRNTIKVAIFTSLFMLFFLTYGHVFSLIDMKSVFGFMIGRHRFIFPIWIALLILGSI